MDGIFNSEWIENGSQIEAIEKSSIQKKTYQRFNFLWFVASFYILIAQIYKLMFYETISALGHALAAVTHSTLVNLFAVYFFYDFNT